MKLLEFTLITALVVLTFYLLIVGQGFLLPLVIALVFWYLINMLARSIQRRLTVLGRPLPTWFSYGLSIFCFIGIIWAIVELISMNLDEVLELAPTYQANLDERWRVLLNYFGVQNPPSLTEYSELIDIRVIIGGIAGSVTSLAANGGIIVIYLLFLMLEQSSLDRKISALINNPRREKQVRRLMKRIGEDVRKYITIKTLISAMTGLLSYAYLEIVGVDFSEFWAILIFLLNFIPTVGSIIATIFPSLIALVQFESLTPFILVVSGVTAIQICLGNILEPRLMGNSLNLSPIVILLNLSLWGLIWGIPGMFLCVPFLVITMIVFSHVPKMRPIAILLSRDGTLSTLPEEKEEPPAGAAAPAALDSTRFPSPGREGSA